MQSKMSIDYNIKNIEDVLRDKIVGKIKRQDTSRLTAPGENYLSLVLRVDLEVEKADKTETVHAVAKRLPLVEKEHAMHSNSMKNEIRWYSEILPIFNQFQKEYGNETIEYYPEYYGSRLSLDPSKTEADSDSVLIIENLIPQGYKNEDRYIGFDLETSKAILKTLAKFHSLPLGLKINKPELFEKIKQQLKPNMPPYPPGRKDGKPPGGSPDKLLLKAIEDITGCAPYMSKLRPLLDRPPGPPSFMFKEGKGPWATITHNDFWVNNVMVKPMKGKETLVKIVDMQMCLYRSFATDLVFFLLSSVQNDVQKDSLDELLKFYYEEFIKNLKQYQVNLELTYEDYIKEVENTAKESEVIHAIFFSTIIFGEKGTGIDAAIEDFNPFEHMKSMIQNMNQHQKDKLVVIASESAKRNWI